MTGFDEREKGYERKFEHDQEMEFKVRARRNHLLGLWAAAKLGLAGADVESYARKITGAAIENDDALIAEIAADLAAGHVALDEAHIRLELEHCAESARAALGGRNSAPRI